MLVNAIEMEETRTKTGSGMIENVLFPDKSDLSSPTRKSAVELEEGRTKSRSSWIKGDHVQIDMDSFQDPTSFSSLSRQSDPEGTMAVKNVKELSSSSIPVQPFVQDHLNDATEDFTEETLVNQSHNSNQDFDQETLVEDTLQKRNAGQNLRYIQHI